MNDADFGFFLVNDLLQTSEIYFSCSFQKKFFFFKYGIVLGSV